MEKQQSNRVEMPFVLGLLEHREGAMAITTSGTPGDIDCADAA